MLKSVWQDAYPNFSLILEKFSQKTSVFVEWVILGLFGNMFVACHMYSRHNWGKFLQHGKTPLYQKGKTFSPIFTGFLQCQQNLIHFDKKSQLCSLNCWEVIDFEECGSLNARKVLFRNTLPQSKCARETNTAEICLAARLS